MTRRNMNTDRGQTTLDFAIAMVIFITFLASTFFLTGSPLVVDSGADTITLQSETEQALVEIQANALTNNAGEYTTNNIESAIATNNPQSHTSVREDVNMTVKLTATNPADTPTVFNGRGDTIRIGPEPPEFATYNTSTTGELEGRPIRVEVITWRERL